MPYICGEQLPGKVLHTECCYLIGFLAAPDGLHAAHVTESSILFQWDVPFTLNITHVEPDIAHYTVYVRNVNTSRTAAINVTRPEFAFTGLPGDVPDPFTLYEFHISAWNVVGEGEKSGPVQASFLNRGLMSFFYVNAPV